MKTVLENGILDEISGGGSEHGKVSEADLRAKLNSMTEAQLEAFEKEVNENLERKRRSP